jgi:hypothetical protein
VIDSNAFGGGKLSVNGEIRKTGCGIVAGQGNCHHPWRKQKGRSAEAFKPSYLVRELSTHTYVSSSDVSRRAIGVLKLDEKMVS